MYLDFSYLTVISIYFDLQVSVSVSVFQPRADPGEGGEEAGHLAQGVRPDLRAEPHLPHRPAGRGAPAGVQGQCAYY